MLTLFCSTLLNLETKLTGQILVRPLTYSWEYSITARMSLGQMATLPTLIGKQKQHTHAYLSFYNLLEMATKIIPVHQMENGKAIPPHRGYNCIESLTQKLQRGSKWQVDRRSRPTEDITASRVSLKGYKGAPNGEWTGDPGLPRI